MSFSASNRRLSQDTQKIYNEPSPCLKRSKGEKSRPNGIAKKPNNLPAAAGFRIRIIMSGCRSPFAKNLSTKQRDRTIAIQRQTKQAQLKQKLLMSQLRKTKLNGCAAAAGVCVCVHIPPPTTAHSSSRSNRASLPPPHTQLHPS